MTVSVAGIPRGRAGPFRAISKAVAAGRRTRRIDVTRDSHRIGPERERRPPGGGYFVSRCKAKAARSEEHTSDLQSLMRISYAVFCLKKKQHNDRQNKQHRKKTH